MGREIPDYFRKIEVGEILYFGYIYIFMFQRRLVNKPPTHSLSEGTAPRTNILVKRYGPFFRHMGNFHIPKPLKGKLGIHRVLKTGDLKNSTFGGHFLVARAKNFSRGHHWETVILGRFMLEKITFKVSRVQFDISPWRADSTYLASGLHSLRGIAE